MELRVWKLEVNVETMKKEQAKTDEKLDDLSKDATEIKGTLARIEGALSLARIVGSLFGFGGIAVIAGAVVIFGLKALGH